MSLIQTQQVGLLRIFTIAQQSLQTNFNTIIDRLNKHEQLIRSNSQEILKHNQSITVIEAKNLSFKQKLCQNITNFDEYTLAMKKKNKQIQQNILQQKNRMDIIEERMDYIEQKNTNQILGKQQQLKDILNHICRLQKQNEFIQKQLPGRQKKGECQVLRRSINEIHVKLDKCTEQLKYMEFKIQKMDLVFEKNENLRKKELLKLKQMEERIQSQNRKSQNQTKHRTLKSERTNGQGNQKQLIRIDSLRNSNFKEETDNKQYNIKFHQEKLLTTLNEKCIRLEKTVQQIGERMKNYSQDQIQKKQPSSIYKVGDKSQFDEKLNSIRPQLIRLWGKCDTLDEKFSFIDRRIEEKSKDIARITDYFKDLQPSKIDERFKTLQAELYSNLKEFKNKVDSKVSTVDYEKSMKNFNERYHTLGEQIIMKSDKLEVKKALLFLESKIKEIILVISQEEDNERQALLTKKQIKCISCDKEVEKITRIANLHGKENWDALPNRETDAENLGKFAMTNYGTLAKKLKKLEGKDLPVLSKKRGNFMRNSSQHLEVVKDCI